MKYKIQTVPIWDAFKLDCECPLCLIEANTSNKIVAMYLGEAVMQPEFRVQVNKEGFCREHIAKLYTGENKLGLALQLGTRTEHITKNLYAPKDTKSAKKLAEQLDAESKSCVICTELKNIMLRYYITIAQMFYAEPEFEKVVAGCNGFCLPHYARLIENSSDSKAKQKAYLAELNRVQCTAFRKANRQTERFIRMFDYDSSEKQFKGSDEVVKKAIQKLHGNITIE